MESTEEKELMSFEDLWENFVSQLTEARDFLAEKSTEIETQTTTCTRIDLHEYNEAKIKVTKLESALETMNLIRVHCLGEKSLVNYV
jgi:hypothetical protein